MKYSLNKSCVCPYDSETIQKSLTILSLRTRSFPESLAVQCISTIAATLLSSGYLNKAIYIINQLLQYLSVARGYEAYRMELMTYLANIYRDNGNLSDSISMYKKADDESKYINIDGCLFMKTKAWLYDECIANVRINILKNLFPGYYSLDDDDSFDEPLAYPLLSWRRRRIPASRIFDIISSLKDLRIKHLGVDHVDTVCLDFDAGCEFWRQQKYHEAAIYLLRGLSQKDLYEYYSNSWRDRCEIYSFRRPPEVLVVLVEVLTGFGDVYKLSPLFQHSLHKSKEFWIEYKELLQNPHRDNLETNWNRCHGNDNYIYALINGAIHIARREHFNPQHLNRKDFAPSVAYYKFFEASPTISTDYGAVNIDGKVKRYPLTGVEDYLAFYRVLNQHRRLPRNYWFTQQHIHLHFLDILDALMYEYDPPEKEFNFSISTPADKSLTSTAWKRENHKKRSRRQFHWNIPRHG